MLNSGKEKVGPMEYQIRTQAKEIKLNAGDVIRDDDSRASCVVDRIEDNTLHVSNVRFSHPYELTKFSLDLFDSMKKTMGIKKVNLNTPLGLFSVAKEDSERDLYRRVVLRWNK